MKRRVTKGVETVGDPQVKIRMTREFFAVELPHLMEESNAATYQDFFSRAVDLYSEVVATLILNPSHRLVFEDEEGIACKEIVIPGLRLAAGRLAHARGASSGFWKSEGSGNQNPEPAKGRPLTGVASLGRGGK